MQAQPDEKLVLSASPRANIGKKGACYLTFDEHGKLSTEAIALEKGQLLFKQPLGFSRIYRWKNQLYFHSLNSAGEFIVYSNKQEVVIERYD